QPVPGIACEGELEVAIEVAPAEDNAVLGSGVMVGQFTKQAFGYRGAGGLGDMDEYALALIVGAQRKGSLVVHGGPAAQLAKRGRMTQLVQPVSGFGRDQCMVNLAHDHPVRMRGATMGRHL